MYAAYGIAQMVPTLLAEITKADWPPEMGAVFSWYSSRMKTCKFVIPALCLASLFTCAQTPDDHLSPNEISAAVSAKPGSGFAEIINLNMSVISGCKAQMPEEFVYTPEGWLNALSANARKQYLPFTPGSGDTLRALTVVSQGCALGTPSGPSCDSITRVAILSDVGGSVVVEAIDTQSVAKTWHNGFGATAACTSMVSKFSMADVQRARNGKGEFLIATFSGSTLLKTYTVKERYLKKLGM